MISGEKSGEIKSEMHKVYFIQSLSPSKDRLRNQPEESKQASTFFD
jgi:hypothetical protein